LAATAAVVIRDAHPGVPYTDAEVPQPEAQPDVLDAPTEAIDLTQLGLAGGHDGDDVSIDAPTQSMPMPVAFAGAQAAAILPSPGAARFPEPTVVPVAFLPAGSPHLRPDPDRLIQTEIVIEDVARAQSAALTRLVIGLVAAGGVIGLGMVGIGEGVALLVRTLIG
jgi:hypothetical protein